MKKNKLLIIILCTGLFLLTIQCKNSTRNSDDDEEYYDESEGFSDGTYCAEVEYYYSETGTRSNYTLLVEIENNELVKINWPNGGWLDASHFSPPDISNGFANFSSDKNVEYSVKILGGENDCDISTYAKDEDYLIQEKEDRDRNQQIEKEEEEEK